MLFKRFKTPKNSENRRFSNADLFFCPQSHFPMQSQNVTLVVPQRSSCAPLTPHLLSTPLTSPSLHFISPPSYISNLHHYSQS